MDKPDYEKLFLLEVLVNEVYIDNASLDLDPEVRKSLKETCVMFQFLNYPALVVCEEDFYKSPSNKNETQLNFKSGKSCLFSLSSNAVPSLPYKFDIKVSVIRKAEQHPMKKVILGTSVINLGDSFSALIHSSVTEADLPLQKTNAGNFEVTDQNNRPIGHIAAFIRLSCYGQLIVTQFQIGADQNAYMFKGTEPKQVVEIPGERIRVPDIQLDSSYELSKTRQKSLIQPPQMTPLGMGYGDSTRDLARYGQPIYEPQQPPQEKEEGNYKEIVAEIRGHSLHIRVPMKSKKSREEIMCKKQLVEDELGPVCKYAPPLNLCDCDFPVPPEAIPRCGPRC